MKLLLNRKFLDVFIPVFFILYVIIGLVTWYVYIDQKDRIINNTVDYYSNYLEQRNDLILALLSPTISDIGYLARQRSVVNYAGSANDKKRLKEDMQLFALNNWDYKQVRFIDPNGMERIRLNWIGDSLRDVPDSDLQNKSSRYYFTKAKSLKAGEIYVSPIDLNIEHGQIEFPYERVIRFATPVYDLKQALVGIIVINQYMNEYFDRISKSELGVNSHFMFLNTEGYWLLGPPSFPTFGFMFNNLGNQNFEHYFPDTWKQISTQQAGSLYNNKGLFIFRHVSLENDFINGTENDLNNIQSDQENDWIFVSYLKKADVPQLLHIHQLFVWALFVSAVILFFIAYIISRLRFRERQYISEVNLLNLELENKIAERTRELSRTNLELQGVNKELESFSYSVSHDLRAPLRHISGFVDLLVKKNSEELTGKGKTYLRYIKEASSEMGTLIDDLLNFSRIGRTEMKLVAFDMNLLIDEVHQAIIRDFGDRDIRWNVGPLPEVTGDYSLLRQVWLNLLSNAVKYSSKKEYSRIDIACEEKEDHFLFSVRDNGVGFDMKYSHKLFGTFQRLHSDADYEGTGIGLAIVRRIVNRHGGHIGAEGVPDEGAVFYFSLPKLNTKSDDGN